MGLLGQDDIKKAKEAKASAGGAYIQDGRYEFTVRNLFLTKTESGTAFIAELRVDKASATGNVHPETKQPTIPNAPGSDCSSVMLTSFKVTFGKLKALILAINPSITEAEYEKILDALNDGRKLFRGWRVAMSTRWIQTKANKKWICAENWQSIKQTKDEAKARAKMLDENALEAEAPAPTPAAPAPVAPPAPAPVDDDLPF